MITLGATSIVVPGNFPIGCVPLYLVNFVTNDSSKYDKLGCLKDYNNFSKFYNQRLKQVIRQLQREYPDVAIVYADYYSALSWVIANAPQLGKILSDFILKSISNWSGSRLLLIYNYTEYLGWTCHLHIALIPYTFRLHIIMCTTFSIFVLQCFFNYHNYFISKLNFAFVFKSSTIY